MSSDDLIDLIFDDKPRKHFSSSLASDCRGSLPLSMRIPMTYLICASPFVILILNQWSVLFGLHKAFGRLSKVELHVLREHNFRCISLITYFVASSLTVLLRSFL